MLPVFIDYRMAIALVGFIAVVASIIVVFGVRGRSLHQAYGRQAAQVGGELVDTVSNVWAIKAFSSRWRERARLNAAFGEEISALTFRILHGSQDLALALVGTAQEFGVITEMLRIIGQRHDLHDRADAVPVAPQHGLIEFRDVSYSYSDGHKVLEHFTLTIPAGQRLGIARAFLKYAPILILDEATAALDSRSERDVQRALQHLMEGRTVSAVAHRLSTLDGVRPPRAPLGGATTLGGNAGLASPSKV